MHACMYLWMHICIHTCIYAYIHVYIHTHILVYKHSCMHVCILDECTGWRRLIGFLKLRVISAKEPLIIGLFCGKWPVKIRHLTYDCHPLCILEVCMYVCIHTAVWMCEAAVAQQPNEHYGYTYIHKYIQYEHVWCIYIYMHIYIYIYTNQPLGFVRLLLNNPTLAIFNAYR